MARTIWKFPLPPMAPGVFEVEVPRDARTLSAGLDPARQLCIWAEVDPDFPRVRRTYYVIGTGHDLPQRRMTFIGTVSMIPAGHPFIFHIYEEAK